MAVSLLSVLVLSLVDVFYCSTNTATLSTRVDKIAVLLVTLSPIPPRWRGGGCVGTRAERTTGIRAPRYRSQPKAIPFLQPLIVCRLIISARSRGFLGR